MTSYRNAMEVGLYREETGLTCSSGQITVSTPVAWNCHANYRTEPSDDDTYTLGVEWLRNVTDSTWNASDITAVSGSTITIGAGHNGDEFNIGYYGLEIEDGDKLYASHVHNLLRAADEHGTMDPINAGYVFNYTMAYSDDKGISDSAVEFIGKSPTTATGNWAFDNNRPFYVSAVKIEVTKSVIQSGKGIKVKMIEGSTTLLYESGSAGIIINDTTRPWITEGNDEVSYMYLVLIPLGMVLCNNMSLTIETYNSNTNIAAGECRAYLMGWHVPDPVSTFDALNTSTAYLTQPGLWGCYLQEVYTADSGLRVGPTPRINYFLPSSHRTHPHFKDEYRFGVEFAYNLNTEEYVTSAITYVSSYNITFGGGGVSDGDNILLGYYSTFDASDETALMAKEGSILQRGDVDMLIQAANRLDRTDFGKNTFPYGVGQYEWHHTLWEEYLPDIGTTTKYADGRAVRSAWQTSIAFDPKNYNARKYTLAYKDYLARSTSGVDETPFYLTGIILFTTNECVSGTKRYADSIDVRVTLNGSVLRQYRNDFITFFPCGTAKEFSVFPVGQFIWGCDVTGYIKPFLYIPLSGVRCYNLKVDIRTTGTHVFDITEDRAIYVEGWIIDND